MAITQYPSRLYVRVSETDELFRGATFTPGADQVVTAGIVTLYNQGTPVAGERARLRLFHDGALQKPLASSAWLYLDAIPGIAAAWLGRIRFDFPPFWVGGAFTYHLGLEVAGYSRSGDARYLGWVLDWPYPVNAQSGGRPGIHFELYGRRRKAR
jgi:hypothetical protein